ncbi:hypothetical protein IKS73_02990, partial [bacterium]|nr:hypothetical protein [bacterium]
MKKSILHILVMIFLIAGEVFSGSVITQRVVNACGFIKGSSTLNLSGQVNYNFLSSSWDGIPMAIYNSLDNYLVMPTLFPRTNQGFGGKTATRNVSVNTSNGKFKWKEKDVKAYFSFSTGEERITPNKAVFKSKGTIDTSKLSELENKKLTIFDKRCSDQGSNYFASLTFFPESKKNKYSYSYNNGGIQAKISINSKFKAKAKFILSPEVAYPVILDSEHIFTNKYDYSLAIVGDGDVSSGFVGPDKVEFRVTENNGKFRYFSYNGTKVTNDFLMLELEDDTEVQAVFGTYDISLNVIGNGSASFEFTGPDEVELTVTKNKDKFRHFAVNGEKWANSEMKFSMQEDTIVEAVFGNYDLNVTVSGRGSVSCEFLKPDEVVVTALSNDGFFNSFQWDENISFKNPLKLTLTKNTELIVVFK